MSQPDANPEKEQATTRQPQKLSMSQYEADRQESLQEAQDEWAESDAAKAVQSWVKREDGRQRHRKTK